MTHIAGFLLNEWTNALGWTLLHSVWQSLVILLIVVAVLRFIPVTRSGLRYAVACLGTLFFLVTTAITFSFVIPRNITTLGDYPASAQNLQIAFHEVSADGEWVSHLASFIQLNMPVILAVWAAGLILFSIRLAGAFLYTQRIRSCARVVENEWTDFVKHTAEKLRLRRLISLAESSAISSPMVVGYLRPLILIPVGMFTGLTTEQLETILLHELAHVKRHDYLINLLQSIVEAIFFFNPFVWILSNVIRREREYCCDDLVIRYHGGTRAYAYALASLAESRLSFPGFGLALGDDRNQLLTRIRRIMEKSVKNYSSKSRIMIPAILLCASLLCISWLGTNQTKAEDSDSVLVDQDTVPPKKQQGARYSRKSIITLDENGQPHEEVVEEFEGDEALRPLMEEKIKGRPTVPGISAVPPFPTLPPDPFMAFPQDTIPPGLGFNPREWEDFAQKFKEQFKDFELLYGLHEGDTSDLLKGFRLDLGLADTSFFMTDHLNESLRQLEKSYKALDLNLEQLQELQFDEFRNLQKDLDLDRFHSRSYVEELRKELIEDGYLTEDEQIESLEWNDSTFKVNGKKIKEADNEKYRKLNDEFFGRKKLDKFD